MTPRNVMIQGAFGGDNGTRWNQGVAAIELAASDSPPDCRIEMGSSPVFGLHQKKKPVQKDGFLFWWRQQDSNL